MNQDKKKRETSHNLCGGPSLASPKWLLLKLFPPVGCPALLSSPPNRGLQAVASGLHPEGSLFLHDPLTEPEQGWVWWVLPSALSPDRAVTLAQTEITHLITWQHLTAPTEQRAPAPSTHPACGPGRSRERSPGPSERLLSQGKMDFPQILCMKKSVGYTSSTIHCVPLDAPCVIGASVSKVAWKYLFYNFYTYFTPILQVLNLCSIA